MSFLSPLLLLALIPVAALAVAYVIMQRRRSRYAVRFAALPMLDRLVPKRPKWRRHVAASLVLLSLLALGTAAARPRLDLTVPYERATVIVAIDTSASMLADDVQPSRLEAAKSAAAGFVEDLPETYNVGVIGFAGSAYVVAPATTDHEEAAERIRALDESGGGTAIGESLFAAVDEVQALTADTPRDRYGDREIIPARMVLLSDGQNTVGRAPDLASAAARAAQLPVSTIAYGTERGSTSVGGQRLSVPVDETTLRQVADATDGRFYEARSSDELRQVYADIGSSIGWHVERTEVTPWLALIGMLLGVVAGALSLRWFSRLV